MQLTAELVQRVHRLELDEGPRPERMQLTDSDYEVLVADLLAEKPEGPLRIFAYGSLIWKPEFESTGKTRGTLAGHHRSFCMKIERWRGTRSFPGLMMALDKGGSCDGLVYQLPDGDFAGQLDKLLRREATNKPLTNRPSWVQVETAAGPLPAITFIANPEAVSYAGKLPLNSVAHTLARAAGHWGSGAEYLYNTVRSLAENEIVDAELWALQGLVAQEIEGMSA